MLARSRAFDSGNYIQARRKAKRGQKGMSLFADRNMNIPTYAKDVYDVTGAGDTVLASLSLAIAAGASLEEAAIIANHAAGISVEKKGTYAVDIKELRAKLSLEEKKDP